MKYFLFEKIVDEKIANFLDFINDDPNRFRLTGNKMFSSGFNIFRTANCTDCDTIDTGFMTKSELKKLKEIFPEAIII